MCADRSLLWAAVLVAMAMVVAGCNSDDSDELGSAEPARTVEPEHLEEFRPDSPERTVLVWWRHVQYRNPAGAHDLYADDADVSREDLERQITFAASSFVGVPDISDVDRGGGLATVYMTVQPPGSEAPPRPLSVNLRQEGDTWRLRDNALMEQQAARVARARAVAEDEDEG